MLKTANRMSIHKDRAYWRVRYWDDLEGDAKDEYFGRDKATALAHAVAICELKVQKWEKRKQEYLSEYKALMESASKRPPR